MNLHNDPERLRKEAEEEAKLPSGLQVGGDMGASGKLWCSFCKLERDDWFEKTKSIMCPECEKKCPSCGGTGKVWIHPRLGLWSPCGCSFGKAVSVDRNDAGHG